MNVKRVRTRPGTRRSRPEAQQTMLQIIGELPRYLRLLYGLLRDGRVALLDKLLVGAAIAYIIAPADLIPDVIPFLGRVDDAYFLVLAMQRLILNSGRDVVAEYWPGDIRDLHPRRLQAVLAAATMFLPKMTSRKLRRRARA